MTASGRPRVTLLAGITFAVAAALGSACTSASTASAPASGPASGPTSGVPQTSASAPGSGALPRPDHVVVVLMENHSYSSIIGDSSAGYINSLAAQGASFTHSYAVAHPSQPNYLALFSGSTLGIDDDHCPVSFGGANLASELTGAGLSFAGYSESMPRAGFTGCAAGPYARKHNPWVDFTNVPAGDNQPFTAFPGDYATLPTVSFVVPNLDNDMHDGTVAQGDAWLRANLDSYVQWAKSHNSELVLTWDEDDNDAANQIPTVVVGAGVRPGQYDERIDHYSVLRMLEDFYGLPHAGSSASAAPITGVFGG